MKLKERQLLRFEWILNREAFARKASRAVLKADWEFLIRLGKLGEALKPKPPQKPKEHFPSTCASNAPMKISISKLLEGG
jgi:hypothetical protein